MKKLFVFSLAVCSLFAFASCKSSKSEYKKLYDELFDEYVVYYMEGKTEEDYSDAEKYKTERAAAEKAVAEYYGEAFFRDQVYYDFAIDALLDYSNLELIEK